MNGKRRRRPPYKLFDALWVALSEQGACDALGGREYLRVRAEWLFAGAPPSIEAFIRRRANIGPDGQEPPA